jgi:hypothetical protein
MNWNWLKKLFKRAPEEWKPEREHDFSLEHYWGHNCEGVESLGDGNYSAFIWTSDPVHVGDAIALNTESGKRGVYAIYEVEGYNDPRDMYYIHFRGVIHYKED